MNKTYLLAILALIGALGGCASSRHVEEPGKMILHMAFDPNRYFEGDLRPSSDDQLILTVHARARDDYAPAYSLAIAYRCTRTGAAGNWHCGYSARILRVEGSTEKSLELFERAKMANSTWEMKNRLDGAAVQWLETEIDACPNGIFAMDSIRIADWRPDIHHALQAVEDREVILHPAAIKVMMHGSYTTTTYEGWVLAPGVPAAVHHLIETLEPCWKLSSSRRPWRRLVPASMR